MQFIVQKKPKCQNTLKKKRILEYSKTKRNKLEFGGDFFSLTKRSFKGFLLNVLKPGRCGPPRLVPPRLAHWFPRQNIPNCTFPPKVPLNI